MADLTLNPSPAIVGQVVYASGCGYDLDTLAPPVLLRITAPDGDVIEYGVGIWYQGACMNPTPVSVDEAGMWTFEAFQRKGKSRKNAKYELKATAVLTVS